MTEVESAAGDPIPPACEVIEVQVTELRQLFNSIDPTPFHERDLDPSVEEFIVEWARELPMSKSLALLVRIAGPSRAADEARIVRDAVHRYFARRATNSRARLRRLFRRGRTSLSIGLATLTALTSVAQLISPEANPSGLLQALHESLLIGGWVAMWRPLEVFLYDWWPIRAEAKLFDRLASMPVRLRYETERSSSLLATGPTGT
jgi:hypothetical protein